MLNKISFNNLNNQVLARLVQANANPSLIRRLPQQFVLNAVATVTATGGFVQNTIELGGRFVMAPVAFVIPSQKLRATFNKQNLVNTAKKVAGFVAAIITSLLGIVGLSKMNAQLQFSKFGTSATEPKAPVRQIVELRGRVEVIEQALLALNRVVAEAAPGFPTISEALISIINRFFAVEARPVAAPVDLSDHEGRIVNLEARPVAAPAAPVDLSDHEGRIVNLEARPVAAPAAPVDLSDHEGRIVNLEAKPAATPEQLQALEGRVSNLSAGFEEGRVTIEKLAAIIDRLQNENTAKGEQFANLQRENTANKELIADLQRKDNAKGELIANLREDYATLRKESDDLRTLVNRQNVRLEELESNKIKRVPTLD